MFYDEEDLAQDWKPSKGFQHRIDNELPWKFTDYLEFFFGGWWWWAIIVLVVGFAWQFGIASVIEYVFGRLLAF